MFFAAEQCARMRSTAQNRKKSNLGCSPAESTIFNSRREAGAPTKTQSAAHLVGASVIFDVISRNRIIQHHDEGAHYAKR